MRIEVIEPILCVRDIQASVQFYEETLGFQNAPWGDDSFTHVSRDGRGIYLASKESGQGQTGAWIWVGVEDIEAFHEELKKKRPGAIRMPPTNYAWAYEMRVEDPDGNVLRLGSDPK
jgi:predicted enzyme related to lactoylglutathione lyase